ncbi:MAG: dicarboxylate/amino acid:cation symporter [Bacteroidales bacterium]|nr:dicarboxylate/amino acid:cation symporter [Bacteroidales bacterium]MBP3270172.1 dicarboxylate/amino acid:cation symporter [Bacteroidales bacterium]
MKKIRFGLFAKVIVAIVCGALLGLVAPDALVRVLKTFNVLFAQILKFIIPLLILGLVTPAIANVGKKAGKMLMAVIAIAYLSTICSGFFAHVCSSNLFPHYLQAGELSAEALSAKEFQPYLDLKITPVCDILTALLLSFMLGIGIIFTGSTPLKKAFDDFGEIIKLTIEKVIIPMLPLYIFTMICEMGARGVIGVVLGSGFKIILTGFALTIVFLVIQYCIAGIIAGKNPFKCLWNMVPAYLTAFSICSSSAAIPMTSACTRKNGVRDDIVDFTIPLCSTVHMCGSTIKLAASAIAVAYLTGTPIPFAVYVNFVLLQGIAAVAAPGVMGGVLMASIGLLESVMGFSPDQTALVMTLYLALDGYGPGCNVTGDGAIALVIDKFFGKDK